MKRLDARVRRAAAACMLALLAASAPAAADVRAALNPGYALLYQQADNLPKMHWLTMFKEQSEPVQKLVDETLDDYRQLASTMEDLAKRHPDLNLELKPLPDIEARAREAVGRDRVRAMKPIVGETGSRYERDLLLLLQDALDEQRHLLGVMLDDEPNAELKRFLQHSKAQLDALYLRYEDLLEKRYFR